MQHDTESADITSLRSNVKLIMEEVQMAISFHETWRPSAFDADIHSRMGSSLATNAFSTIRFALRREVILTLMRIWDKDGRSTSMKRCVNSLKDKRISQFFIDEIKKEHGQQPVSLDTEGLNQEQNEQIRKAFRNSEQQYANSKGEYIMHSIGSIIEKIDSYMDGGKNFHMIESIKTVRDQRIAHRKINVAVVPEISKNDKSDDLVEVLYLETICIVKDLYAVIERTHYDLDGLIEIRKMYASLFWQNVKGERTEGHPRFRKPFNPVIHTAPASK